MKNNYLKQLGALLIVLFISIVSYSQDIHFTFDNPQITNDGVDDYYEADIMIETINTTGSFKLGSGQLYFTYNTMAFGENINANSNFEVTYPNGGGYVCGQYVDAAAAGIYGAFTINDNTTSRVSWSFSQTFSSATFATDNINDTPKKLCHVKIKYLDVNEQPNVLFETGTTYLDQFFTACGPDTGGAFETADCGANPGTQLFNDTFDSSNASLSTDDYDLLKGLTIYPNPVNDILSIDFSSSLFSEASVKIYDILGKIILVKEISNMENQIDISKLQSGSYFIKIETENETTTKKIIKK